jgi:hypothetical protein
MRRDDPFDGANWEGVAADRYLVSNKATTRIVSLRQEAAWFWNDWADSLEYADIERLVINRSSLWLNDDLPSKTEVLTQV